MVPFRNKRNAGLAFVVTAGALLVFVACGSSGDKDVQVEPKKDAVAEVKAEVTAKEVTVDVAADNTVKPREVVAEVAETVAEVKETVAEVAETVEEVTKDASTSDPCDPPPAAGTLFALAGPDRETGEEIPLCPYKGDVVLIVNTAAL